RHPGSTFCPYTTLFRSRNPSAGDIENTGLRIAAVAAVDYELPLNDERTLLLVPELRYSFPFTKIRSDVEWSVQQLRGGIALKYRSEEHTSELQSRENLV